MQKLGLIEKASGRIDPVHFFHVNMKGFFQEFGVRFSAFSVKEAPEELEMNVLLVRQETEGHDAITVYMNKKFIRDLRKVPKDAYVSSLWYHLTSQIRKWAIYDQKVSIMDIIPPSVLCDEMDNTEDISKTFFEMHQSKEWNDLEVAQNFDAATVGLYIANSIISRPDKLSETSFKDVAELIWKLRRGNWHKLTEEC